MSDEKNNDSSTVEVPKKFAVFYTIVEGSEPVVSYGTDYKLSSLDIQSANGQILPFPVIFVIDDELDSLEIIPVDKIKVIRYNYGYASEAKKFQTQMEVFRKETKKRKNVTPRDQFYA